MQESFSKKVLAKKVVHKSTTFLLRCYHAHDTIEKAVSPLHTALKVITRNTMQELDYQFLDTTVKALVDNPDSVKITREVDEMGVLLTLEVSPDDMGKIIGRQGNTAKAIRTLLRIVGMKNNARVNLKINEPDGGSSDAQSVDDAIDDLKME